MRPRLLYALQSGLAYTTLTALAAASPAFADGLVYNGHVAGSHTNITLTVDQIASLKRGKSKILLSSDQRKVLSGLPDANIVTELQILSPSTAGCTCDLRNVGVRINKTTVEVADLQFGNDNLGDFSLWQKRSEEIAAAKAEEKEAPTRTKEADLNAQGEKAMGDDMEAAIPFFQKALQLNPDYKLSKWNLASAYSCAGHNLLYGKPEYARAARYLELALTTAVPDDKPFIDSVNRELRIAKSHLGPVSSQYSAKQVNAQLNVLR